MPNKFWAISTIVMVLYVIVPYKNIDPRARPFYNAYMKEVRNNCHYPQYYSPGQTIITLKHLTASEQICDDSGQCHERVNVGNCVKRLNRIEIDFDIETWKTLTDADRYKFLAHEMSHCILGLAHSDNPNDLMYPVYVAGDQATVDLEVTKAIKSACR